MQSPLFAEGGMNQLPRARLWIAAIWWMACFGTAWPAAAQPAAGSASDHRPEKIVMIAGPTHHGRGAHEHDKGLLLVKQCLEASPNAGGLRIEVHSNNWPANPATLDDADTIVMFNEGWNNHLLARPERRGKVRGLTNRGVGLVCLHAATAVSDDAEKDFLQWAGGNKKQVYSQLTWADGQQTVAAPGHPVARGVKAFCVKEELYYRYRFAEDDKRRTPILTAMLPPEKPHKEVIAWAFEREDGGRAFLYAGPHFHSSWRIESLRTMVLNAILWTAKAEVPAGGVRSSLPADAKSTAPLKP